MLKKIIRNSVFHLASFIYNDDDSKILFYHDIHKQETYCDFSTSIETFLLHIETIRQSKFSIVNSINQRNHQVCIQFDDGYKGIADCINYLVEYQIPIEVFVITDNIGKTNFLDKEDMQRLLATGLVKFSSHTHTHKKLSDCDTNTIVDELVRSKRILEDICKTNIDSICYPYGLFSTQVIECCESLGFTHQYSSLPGSYHHLFKDKVRRRNLIQFASKSELNSVLKGAHNILNHTYIKRHFKI